MFRTTATVAEIAAWAKEGAKTLTYAIGRNFSLYIERDKSLDVAEIANAASRLQVVGVAHLVQRKVGDEYHYMLIRRATRA